MDADQRARILRALTDGMARRHLLAPARIALDVLAPVSFLAGQAALFLRPFAPLGRWQDYIGALEDEEGWKVLRRLVDHQDS